MKRMLLGGVLFLAAMYIIQDYDGGGGTQFESVYPPLTEEKDGRKFVTEMQNNPVLQSYMESLIPSKPSNTTRTWFAHTRPLKKEREIKAKVLCDTNKIMYHLFVRSKHGEYRVLNEKNGWYETSIRNGDQLVAVGNVAYGDSPPNYNKVIKLKVED